MAGGDNITWRAINAEYINFTNVQFMNSVGLRINRMPAGVVILS